MGELIRVLPLRQEIGAVALDANGGAAVGVAGYFVALGLEGRPDRRIKEAALRGDQLLCLRQRRLRRRNAGIGLERLFNQRIQRRRLEQFPPFEGEVPARDEVLRLAALDQGGRAGLRQGGRGVAGVGRSVGPVVARTDGAAGRNRRHSQESDDGWARDGHAWIVLGGLRTGYCEKSEWSAAPLEAIVAARPRRHTSRCPQTQVLE